MKWMLIFFFAITQAQALEVDEKLTMRVLKLSETRKTMLVNRGTEDGLAEGDHAKFYIAAGVVARGVIIKVSPSRSVWSIYRLVNADLVVPDAVMSLKITPPVKVTPDETKMVAEEDQPTNVTVGDPQTVGIPLAPGANDIDPNSPASNSEADLAALKAQMGPTDLHNKHFELWGALHVSSLASKTEPDNEGEDSYSGADMRTQLTLAGEYYMKNEDEWWSRFSPFAFLSMLNSSDFAFQGSKQKESATEFGGGLNLHPWARPSVINEFIPFFTGGFALGKITNSYESGSESPGNNVTLKAQGSTFSTNIGVGFKFYTARGFGARAILDYYMRNDTLKDSDSNSRWTRSVAGPRLWVGLGHRF